MTIELHKMANITRKAYGKPGEGAVYVSGFVIKAFEQ